jgi:uncharacterized protein YeaO (DUF488 family)
MDQGDKENIDAVLQISMAANTSAYDAIRREAGHMCEAFQELFKDELKEREKKGSLETLIGLVKDNLITLSEAAKRADMTEALFAEKMTQFGK